MGSLLMTDYFRDDVLAKRTYIRLEWRQAAIAAPVRKEVRRKTGGFAIGYLCRNSANF